MSAVLRLLVNIEANNLKSEDAFVNRFHFQTESDPPAGGTITAMNTAVAAFYNNFGAWWSTSIYSGALHFKWYNMADPQPRAPISNTLQTVTGLVSSASMPPEVAEVISFEASTLSGVPQPRRRNRVYLPPFITSRYNTNGDISNASVASMATVAATLLAASDAASDWTWVVRSETTGAVAPVTRGWVDGAPDIQRRRGRVSTVRSLFP